MNSLFATVESSRFGNDATALNTLSTLTSYIGRLPEAQTFLMTYAANPSEGQALLLERIKKLLVLPTDARYLHEYDGALATYMYLLYQLGASRFKSIAATFELPKNVWWAGQMLTILGRTTPSSFGIQKLDLAHGRVYDDSSYADVNTRNSDTKIIKGAFA